MNEITKLYLKVLRNVDTKNWKTSDLKKLFILKIIDKKTEIIDFRCTHIDCYDTEERMKEAILFKNDRYRVTFLYNGVEMYFFKESSLRTCTPKLEAISEFNKSEIKNDLYFLKDFFNDDSEYSKEDLLEIKNTLIKCMDSIVDRYNADKLKKEARIKRNETTKNNLNDFLKELD